MCIEVCAWKTGIVVQGQYGGTYCLFAEVMDMVRIFLETDEMEMIDDGSKIIVVHDLVDH